MWERVRSMLVKEFIQVFRDPRMRVVLFLLPCVQVLVIGHAVTTDVRNIRTIVCDRSDTVASRRFLTLLEGSPYFRIVDTVDRAEELTRSIDRGEAILAIEIDPRFAADLYTGRRAKVQAILDGSDSNTAGVVAGYLNQIASGFSEQVLVERFERLTGRMPHSGLVQLRNRAWFNEDLESRNFYVPGVLAIVVSLAALLLTSMAVVREKEIGTMEQIVVTPIRPLEYMLGKTLPFALIAMIDVAVVTAVGVLWFQVPIRGSLLLLFATSGLYVLAMLGIGLFISTTSQTQQQAMMSTFLFFFPAMLLSGFAFPIANMPPVVQWITLANPLRYYLEIIRGIFLKGIGLSVLWPQTAALGVMAAGIILWATTSFRKQLG